MHGSEMRAEDFKGFIDPAIEAEEPAETPAAETEVEAPTEQPETEAQSAEEPAEESQETEPDKPVESEAKAETPETKVPSRAAARIKELVAKNKELEAKQALIEMMPAPANNDELDMNSLQHLIDQRAMEVAKIAMSQIQTNNELVQHAKTWSEDLNKVKQEHPELDPKSPSYDAELDATLARMLDDGTGRPRLDILVSDVVKPFFNRLQTTAKSAEDKGKSEVSATLAKQSAESAVTPTPKSSKGTVEYTDAELARMSQEEPVKYMRLIKNHKI